ncbi:LVIVD repeat-containing protein [Aquimarina rubra]|uniref:LVIVD repeat-containing protein n=1 Tax=Aquimarina rubra TaxID=1920033 RepID=A0ABW5LD79_9FLAO
MKKYMYMILTSFIIFSCDSDTNSDTSSPTSEDGQGGSLATFTLKGDYLYTVDNTDLTVFNITDIKDPVQVNTIPIGFNIETLFSYKNYLYIGSRNGMFIYGLTNPEFPEKLSQVEHFTACDPVIANDTHAFVTLHSDTFCGNNINVLEIYDVTTVTEPILINSRNLTFPKGLGLYGDFLIVCDDEIKVFDVSNPSESNLVTSVNRSAFDVIISGDLLIAIGETGLYQYRLATDINSGISITELSTINI